MNISRILAKKLAPILLDDLLNNQPHEDFYFLEINIYGNGYIYHWNRITGTQQYQTDIWEKNTQNPDVIKKLSVNK